MADYDSTKLKPKSKEFLSLLLLSLTDLPGCFFVCVGELFLLKAKLIVFPSLTEKKKCYLMGFFFVALESFTNNLFDQFLGQHETILQLDQYFMIERLV